MQWNLHDIRVYYVHSEQSLNKRGASAAYVFCIWVSASLTLLTSCAFTTKLHIISIELKSSNEVYETYEMLISLAPWEIK
jgi:hypothetical protein